MDNNSKNIISLRPNPDCFEDINIMKKLGINCIPLPMLEFKIKKPPTKEMQSNVSGIVITSKRSLDAVKLFYSSFNNSFFKKPVFCIGKKTAESARKVGFKKIISGNSNALELIKIMKKSYTYDKRNYLWLSSKQVSKDLRKYLDKSEINLIKHDIYEMNEVSKFSQNTIDLISSGNIDGIMTMSKRTLKNFKNLLKKYDIWEHHKEINLFSISYSVSNSVRGTWKKKFVPDEPNNSKMMETIKLFKGI